MSETNRHLIDYTIAQGDDALILGQRLSQWCSRAPFLEEDLALANVALDYIGRAQMFYNYAVKLEGGARSADDIAFMRDSRDYCNLLITELPIGNFADTMARQFILDLFNVKYLEQLIKSTDSELAAIAAKAVKESHYHLRRSHEWVLRLGDGTEESHAKIQCAFDALWGYTPELFEMTAAETALLASGVSVDRAALRGAWNEGLEAVLAEATLRRPADGWKVTGGRNGVHTEHHGHLLCEMQFLQRAYPGLRW